MLQTVEDLQVPNCTPSVWKEGVVVPIAVAAVVVLTAIVWSGIRESNRVNFTIVSITVFSPVFFRHRWSICRPVYWIETVGAFLPDLRPALVWDLWQLSSKQRPSCFVAFTGYARIATLGEEVRDPSRTIPRAIMVTLALSAVLYIGVGAVGIATIGSEDMVGAARTK